MARPTHIRPTGLERPWGDEELIVTKTDTQGKITYANNVFLRLAILTEKEALGQPHNIIRHPEMPRCVFKLLWDTLEAGREIFAYVNNMAMNGDHYWVFAHVTPSFDPATKQVVGYHSNRRKPIPQKLEIIKPVYQALLREEQNHASPKEAVAASTQMLLKVLQDKGVDYDKFILTL